MALAAAIAIPIIAEAAGGAAGAGAGAGGLLGTLGGEAAGAGLGAGLGGALGGEAAALPVETAGLGALGGIASNALIDPAVGAVGLGAMPVELGSAGTVGGLTGPAALDVIAPESMAGTPEMGLAPENMSGSTGSWLGDLLDKVQLPDSMKPQTVGDWARLGQGAMQLTGMGQPRQRPGGGVPSAPRAQIGGIPIMSSSELQQFRTQAPKLGGIGGDSGSGGGGIDPWTMSVLAKLIRNR